MTLAKKFIKPVLIAFLIIYFLYLVLSRAPAEIAASALHKAVPNLWLTGVAGTVWNGRAGGAQIDLPGSTLALGRLDWKLSPFSLVLLRPCIAFQFSGAGQVLEGTACQSIAGNTSLKDMNIETSIAPLSDVIRLPISGKASLQIVKAKVDLNSLHIDTLDARLSWQNGSINPENTGWINLGTFAGKLKENGNGGIAAEIFDIEAPIKVQMNASLIPSTLAWQLDGNVQPLDQAPALLKDNLGVIGEEKEPGIFHIVLSSD
ncbi:type II secretion system protein N (GspN) [Alteromonadaceae bacterium Bs31]|nr:type II secretion system protein N (GspN) [Alteromonadaceae bacterium Bs31]